MMRVILQSSYLTLEYLLWRQYNINNFVLPAAVTNIRISTYDFSSRNLLSLVSDSHTNHWLLKQFGSITNSVDFIDNEYQTINFLQGSAISNNIPKVVFYDADNKIIGFEFLEDYTNGSNFILPLFFGSRWSEIENLVTEMGKTLCLLHQVDVSELIQNKESSIKEYDRKQILHIPEKYRTEDFIYFYQHWNPIALIHFDCHISNFMLDRTGQALKLIDWEFTMIGDPFWDLALFIMSVCERLGGGTFFTDESPGYFTEIKGVVAAFLKSYFKDCNNDAATNKRLQTYLRLQVQANLTIDNDNYIKRIENLIR